MNTRSDGPLTPIDLASLLEQPDHWAQAGLRFIDQLTAAGRYVRSTPTLYNLATRYPVGARIRDAMSVSGQDYPALHRVVLEDASVTGQGTVVAGGALLIRDSCREILDHRLVPTGLRQNADGSWALASTPTRRISRPSLLVKRPWWQNYGHWLLDSAALLALIPGIRMPADWQIVIGGPARSPAMRDVVEHTLNTLAPGVPVVRHPDHETWVFDELHYTTPVSRPGLFKSPQALAALRAQFLGSHYPSHPRKKLYVARDTGDRRRLVNDATIAAVCVARGFEVVRPEQFSLPEQAQLFRSADVMVGVKGAALTNLLFCTSAAAVVVLSPPRWMDVLFWDLAGQLGMDYIEIFGESDQPSDNPSHQPFTIDPALVTRALDELDLARGQPVPPHGPDGARFGTDSRAIMATAMPPHPRHRTLVAKAAPPPSDTMEVFAHIEDEGDVAAPINQPIGGAVPHHTIEGFGIRAPRDVPPDEIEYRAVVGKNWPTPWFRAGAYCGTRGWHLPLFGFAVRLSGRTEQRFRCQYDATFADGTVLRAVPEGQDCVAGTLAPLTSLTIRMQRRSLSPVRPTGPQGN